MPNSAGCVTLWVLYNDHVSSLRVAQSSRRRHRLGDAPDESRNGCRSRVVTLGVIDLSIDLRLQWGDTAGGRRAAPKALAKARRPRSPSRHPRASTSGDRLSRQAWRRTAWGLATGRARSQPQESLSVKRNASVARSQRTHPLWAYNLNIVSEKPANARFVGERPGEARGWRR